MKGAFATTDAPPSGSKYSAFGTFLDTLRQGEAHSASAREQEGVRHRATPKAGANVASRQVLAHLAEHGSQPVSNIIRALDVGILEFAEALPALVDTGLVELRRTETGEVLGLTDLGMRVESLLDPAL